MTEQENKLGIMPVRPLLLRMSWPIMLSMFAQALYNLVDSVYVTRISEEAFLAVSFAYPLQNFMVAIFIGTGVGINALLSRRLGEKRSEDANQVALNGFFVYLCCFLILFVFGLIGPNAYYAFFTDNTQIRQYGTQYLSIICCCSVGVCMQFACERVLQASGYPMGHMLVQGTGVIFNVIFDPLLIFGLFGFPKLGVAGAAVATIGGELAGMCVGLFLISRIEELKLHIRGFRPSLKIIREIYSIGFPAIVAQSLVTIMTLGMNKILSLFSNTLVVVLNYYFKLQTFVFMPLYGLGNGMIPIVGFNYGAGKSDRITSVIRFALFVALGIMIPGMVFIFIFPKLVLLLFNPGDAAIAAGVPALRIITVSFPFAAINVILSAAFQAVDASFYSLQVSFTRQIIIVLPILWILGLMNPALVWWSIPLSEALGMILALILYRRIYLTKIAGLRKSQDLLGGTIV